MTSRLPMAPPPLMMNQTPSEPLVLPDACHLTPTALSLPVTLTYPEYERVMGVLLRLEGAVQFAIGDALLFGEHHFAEYTQVIPERTHKTLMNYQWVAEAVAPQLRNPALSWSHHEAIAGETASKQREWLNLAATKGWTVQELRGHVRPRKKPPEEPFKCPECGHTGNRVDFKKP